MSQAGAANDGGVTPSLIVETLTGNSGGAVGPTANNINTLGTGSITVVGNPGTSTLTTQLTGLTNHNVLVGAGTATITSVVPSTAGFVLTSNGAALDPSFQAVSASGAITTITGNSGGAESPSAGNFNIVGTGSITSVGTAATETIQVTGLTNHNVLVGAGTATITKVAPSATAGVPLISAGAAADPAFGTAVVAGGGTGIVTTTAYAPIVGGTTATGPFQSASTGLATSGFVLTSNGNAAVPSFQTVSASGAITTITGNSGGAESPSSGNFNVLGTGSITVAGTANTETVQLTGLTNHALLIGAGTATITNVGPSASTGQILQNNASADPSYSTATYPSTTTINQILYSSSTNVVGGLSTANQGVLTTGATGIPVITALATNGQLIIGSTAGVPAAATLTPGSGISITNGSNSITIAATGSEAVWTDEGISFAAASGNGYFITANVTATLPASPSQGDVISFIVDAAATVTITGNTGQVIRIGAAVSAAAGTATNNARGDSVSLVYRSSGTAWIAESVIGTWVTT